jgi:DNA helicase II / ATP-dependent DNA helicase PcrA
MALRQRAALREKRPRRRRVHPVVDLVARHMKSQVMVVAAVGSGKRRVPAAPSGPHVADSALRRVTDMTADAGGIVSPRLTGAALDAVRHRGGHLQIIASAGSGKTEVVSQRVADLLADGVPAESVVAFTFTERAADELKNRIVQRVEDRLGRAALDRLAGLFVGTMHAFCFRFLQQWVPRYETYDVLDDNQLTAFLSREAGQLQLRQLDAGSRLFASIEAFLKSVDVVENELLEPATMPDQFRTVLRAYYDTLDRYRLLTYGQQIVRAVKELERPELAAQTHARLRHLIVDEYQDVNPAQERLIELLTGPQVHLCVVGDDQQAIYQWRGSDVSNIVTFPRRYSGVATFEITTNRRSRPQIIEVANRFARTIPDRIDKTMAPHRPADTGSELEVVVWNAPDETGEAGWITKLILDLADAGVRYRDIAVLVRSRAAYARLVEQFATFDIPVQPGGRSGLFDQPEAVLLGHTICWLADVEWRDRYGPSRPVEKDALLSGYQRVFRLTDVDRRNLGRFLRQWKAAVPLTSRTANLVGELYELLDELSVRAWDLSDPMVVNRLGTLARFSSLQVACRWDRGGRSRSDTSAVRTAS